VCCGGFGCGYFFLVVCFWWKVFVVFVCVFCWGLVLVVFFVGLCFCVFVFGGVWGVYIKLFM
jgi:hypothetical protein